MSIGRTPWGPLLGSTNPGTTIVALEPLDIRRRGFSPLYILLIPTFLLVQSPRPLTHTASTHVQHSSTTLRQGFGWRAATSTKLRDETSLLLSKRRVSPVALAKGATYQQKSWQRIHVFGTELSPYILSAQDRLTSELLRFL